MEEVAGRAVASEAVVLVAEQEQTRLILFSVHQTSTTFAIFILLLQTILNRDRIISSQ
jgi:hypothetical protein